MTYVKGMKKEKRCFFANIVILMREFLPINTKKYKNVLLNGLQFDSLPYAFEVSGCSPALKNDTIFQPLRKKNSTTERKKKIFAFAVVRYFQSRAYRQEYSPKSWYGKRREAEKTKCNKRGKTGNGFLDA